MDLVVAIEETLKNLHLASLYYVVFAFANLDDYKSLDKYLPLRKEFLNMYSVHDFQFDESKMVPEAVVCAKGLTKANSIQSMLDVWNSVDDDVDVADNIWEYVLRPFEIQMQEMIAKLKQV